MRFKHSLQVFIDNIATTYKLLLYRLFVAAIITALACAVIIPSVRSVTGATEYTTLKEAMSDFWGALSSLKLTQLDEQWVTLKEAIGSFNDLLTGRGIIAIDLICAAIILNIYTFLVSLGDFALGETLSNRMTLRAHTPYVGTLIKDIKTACMYSLLFVPAALLFYAIGGALIWLLVFKLLGAAPLLLRLFLASALIITIIALRFSLMTDWMPSVIHSKKKVPAAIREVIIPKPVEFVRVLASVIIMVLLIAILNVSVAVFTFGAGLIITIPAGTMLMCCYKFVNYYDNHGMKYFVDDYIIIGPKKESPLTREEFFKGNDR